ncbi:MAG: DNA polymerase III subunit beta [Deltaproteobacteria bacterium]|jgi:DNA polymerase-3 subunit beta|nr:DNA polymerase III subunit beta [Deltaproteobacteria bacterium]
MYIKVYKEDVIEGLQKAASIIPARSGAAYLRSIWLKVEADRLEIMATDSSIEFKGSYPAEVIVPGLAGVQGRTFVDLLRQLSPGQISLKLDEESGNLLIEQGRRKYKLPANDAVWFQSFSEFPEANSGETVIWSGDYIQELIDRINYCISDDDAMDAIACLSIKPTGDGKIDACGLNGHQFAMQRFMHDDLQAMLPADGILIQKKYLGELKKWLADGEVELSLGEKRLFFRSNDKKETFSLPLSAYQYPDYMGFLNKLEAGDVAKLDLDRKEAMEALERVQLFNSDSNRCTFFDFSAAASKEVVLSTNGQNTGSATEILDGEYSGSIDKIAFPTRNLIEILSHYQSKSLRLVMSGNEGPCGIFGDDDQEYTVIIMPMKIFDQTYYSEESV